MPAVALLLVLASAILHAGWNLVVKSSGDRLSAAWAQLAVGGILGSPLLVARAPYLREVWWLIGISAVVESIYILTLVAAYQRADLGVVYPIARGTAPVLVTIGGWLALADRPTSGVLAGVGLIVAGILALAVGRRLPGAGWALATGCGIALYTLIDTRAVRQSGEPLAYTAAVFLAGAVLLWPVLLHRRGGVSSAWSGRVVVAGAFAFAAYGLVLIAVRMAPVAPVAALRESSVVLGAVGAWLFLGEPLGARRIVAAGLVAVGAGVLALG